MRKGEHKHELKLSKPILKQKITILQLLHPSYHANCFECFPKNGYIHENHIKTLKLKRNSKNVGNIHLSWAAIPETY